MSTLMLTGVACCPDMACTLVSLRLLRQQGYYWDNRAQATCLRRIDNDGFVCSINKKLGQYVIEDLPNSASDRSAFQTRPFAIRRHAINSSTNRAPNRASAELWHLRLGHPGPQALEHLVNVSQGVKITGIQPSTTIKGIPTYGCKSCAVSKIKRKVRRTAREEGAEPGHRLAIDFHDLLPDEEGFSSLMLVTDRYSGYSWDYYLSNRKAETIIDAIHNLFNLIRHQYRIRPKVIESDNELAGRVAEYLSERSIRFEPSAPYTQAQNGGAERAGSTIKTKARTMRDHAKLPGRLWREYYRASVYLYNRSPRWADNWKTPYELFHGYLSARDGRVVLDSRPQQGHLRAYGCRTYAMSRMAHEKLQRRDRFQPRAWIGFLVGYNSTNIYRVWNPITNAIHAARDVIFDENSFFSGNPNDLRIEIQDGLKDMDSEQHQRLIEGSLLPDQAGLPSATNEDSTNVPTDDDFSTNHPGQMTLNGYDHQIIMRDPRRVDQPSGADHHDRADQPSGADHHDRADQPSSGADRVAPGLADQPNEADQVAPDPAVLPSPDEQDEEGSDEGTDFHPYPTPATTPPHRQTFHIDARQISNGTHNMRESCYHSAFMAGTQVGKLNLGAAAIERALEKKIRRNDLPPLPKYHSQLANHPMGDRFLEAERTHLKSHTELGSWREAPIPGSRPQILDCKWVYVYKFDKDGLLDKCKARLVVRGDQQRDLDVDTYAATLASKSFRSIMAAAARHDLELTQYDVTNAFVNASLPASSEIYMRQPPGHRHGGSVLRLQKALYGLKQSPKLWQQHFTAAMNECGFKPMSHESCCFVQDGVILFAYVDDLVFAYPASKRVIVDKAIKVLQSKFKLTGGKDLQWFLGIEILRDRANRTMWLSQAVYMDKLLAHLRPELQRRRAPTTPIREEEHLPSSEKATPQSIHRYQRKMGGALYPAIITRPDTAFAASRLGRFASNPNAEHHEALDRLIHYLYATRFHALQIGGSNTEPDMLAISDASFADNTVDRKSSQGLVISFYGGTVYWRATKQDTVTTSTTEAELLALSNAAKEGLFLQRLIREMKLAPVPSPLLLQCDNLQTVGLVMKDDARLATKLRHVDIHNHWLRQSAKDGSITVKHIRTDEMLADGLTKALTPGKFKTFRQQIGVIDIIDRLNHRMPPPPDQDLVDQMEDLLL